VAAAAPWSPSVGDVGIRPGRHNEYVRSPGTALPGVTLRCSDQLEPGRSEGADGRLACSLAVLVVSETVHVAPQETTARQQLVQHHPPAVGRHLDLDEEPSSPRRARLFVKTACKDWQLDAIGDDATLVASELVENALSDAGTSCRLSIRRDARGLTITVRDYRYRGLPLPLALDPAGHRGHGLFLVAAISQAWGVSPTEDGKSVWALLPVTDPVTNAPRHPATASPD
jgi:hypothetical protein